MSETDFDLAALEAATRKMPGNYTRTELALVAECRKLTDENAQLKADLLALLKMPDDAAQAWVPCSERLPTEPGEYFGLWWRGSTPQRRVAQFDGIGWRVWDVEEEAYDWHTINPTHWRPLPSPPEAK